MKKLVKGTAEYNEAMLKANETAMELIRNNKELANSYTVEDGLIIIDEKALAKVKQEELEKLGKMQASTFLA
jgi:hypothetical protein